MKLHSEIQNSEVASLPSIRLETLFYKNYYSLIDISLSDFETNEDIERHIFSIVVYYLAFDIKTYENSINFVKNFYESYMLYDMETVLLSMFDPTSTFYDNSLESKVGGSLAIYDMIRHDNAYKGIFVSIMKSLQKA